MAPTANYTNLVQKIDELNRTAWELRVSDSEKAFACSKEAAELSRQINYAKGLADGLRVIGFALIRKSNFDEAGSKLEEALQIYQSINNLHGQAAVYEYFGIIQRNKGNSKAALESIYRALELSRQTGFTDNEVTNLYQLGVTYRQLADYDRALDCLFESLLMAKSAKFQLMEGYNMNVIGSIYFETGDYQQALNYFIQGLPIRKQSGDKWGEAGSLDNIGHTCLKLHQYGEAIHHCKQSLDMTKLIDDKKGQANTLLHLAEIYWHKKEMENAIKFSKESLEIRKSSGDKRGEAEVLLLLAGLQNAGSADERQYLQEAITIAEEVKATDLLSKARYHLYSFFKNTGLYKEAIEQMELHTALEAELHKNTIIQKIANLEISHNSEEVRKESEFNRIKNEELIKLNKEIEEQKNKLELTLKNLRETQAQLIQSEKMASLGELTAGIAHEIQNPLNFVNNFSEVNSELITEMKDELTKGNMEEAKTIATAINDNEQKIIFHGKRADAIVKGMLQHSRSSSGQKEPTNINALADEYLRLAYHGLRAKDKSFNATMKTDYDESIGKINIVPQDIGRVILNLITNAFYAVTEKKKQSGGSYDPTVSISTKKFDDKVEVLVQDNGNGVPKKVLDKIFQPFFTTKPTGQGTGLGLSISYDIVKAHGGELKIKSKEGEGSEFIIQLPI